jgi:hypothetical protein
MAHDDNSSSRLFASFKSNISKPSVNQPYTGASRLRASHISANTDREIALTSTKQPSLPRSLKTFSASTSMVVGVRPLPPSFQRVVRPKPATKIPAEYLPPFGGN